MESATPKTSNCMSAAHYVPIHGFLKKVGWLSQDDLDKRLSGTGNFHAT
jgi:hypothetical protein